MLVKNRKNSQKIFAMIGSVILMIVTGIYAYSNPDELKFWNQLLLILAFGSASVIFVACFHDVVLEHDIKKAQRKKK